MSPDAPLPQPPSIGAGALLRWLLRRATVPVALATLAACTSNIIQATVPAFLGQALDAGIENGLNARVWGIGALLLVLFVVYAVGDTMLSYFGVAAWMRTAFDVDRLVGRQVSATGADLSRQVSTGEVATIIASDAEYLGNLIEYLPALLGAAASFIVVAVLMLRTSVSLGLVVILGMPLVAAIVTLVIRPLQKRQAVQREAQSAVTTITTDTVAGLRILRGIGGEDVFARRYREASQELRRRGVEVASSQATLMTLQVLLPGLFAAIVVWIAARMAVSGSLTPGGLITFYGYTAYLSWPLWIFTNSVQDYTRAIVGARRLSRLLEVTPAAGSLVERLDLDPAAAHPVNGGLVDTRSGLRLEEGRMTALVCPDPEVSAELATRLGRFTDSGPTVTLAGRPLATMPLGQVRASIVVSGATAQLFTGTLREALDVRGGPDPQPAGVTDLVRAEAERTTGADVDQQVRAQEREAPGDDRLLEAIEIADAGDVLTSLSEGLAGMITEKGRSLSGGQRQRVALARALLTEAPALVLIEPTSALDSHTEARVAARVHRARAGRTTVVVTASPLVLEACDEVVFLDSSGAELLRSTHRELMAMARSGDAQAADYRAVVSRALGEDTEVSC
ncbi:ABC transporter ATP-binding protein [Actinomyces naeslundii]|uniref:ABC transporter ATP-binding protein n=2 Tax=Actinomyces naeslundii TaxID=1655 RepID=UPI00096D2E2E|nr:ABC transporter ATP-binding protein [Actinomyces naeslundii]OMG24273.1 ABC transporter permease [Actinomyces naeslundii]OMG28846.1 ABC transporter permease [Actinomyces naeslundii]OMG36302.1 ABC transporter permease [Actinomyces naeslundii]OMG40621.1 ABC transporter permease [Actinomyces naeslundii]